MQLSPRQTSSLGKPPGESRPTRLTFLTMSDSIGTTGKGLASYLMNKRIGFVTMGLRGESYCAAIRRLLKLMKLVIDYLRINDNCGGDFFQPQRGYVPKPRVAALGYPGNVRAGIPTPTVLRQVATDRKARNTIDL